MAGEGAARAEAQSRGPRLARDDEEDALGWDQGFLNGEKTRLRGRVWSAFSKDWKLAGQRSLRTLASLPHPDSRHRTEGTRVPRHAPGPAPSAPSILVHGAAQAPAAAANRTSRTLARGNPDVLRTHGLSLPTARAFEWQQKRTEDSQAQSRGDSAPTWLPSPQLSRASGCEGGVLSLGGDSSPHHSAGLRRGYPLLCQAWRRDVSSLKTPKPPIFDLLFWFGLQA